MHTDITTVSPPQKNTGRNSSIELLRVLSMLMIVACHFASHGGFSFQAQNLTIPRFWWHFLEMGGNLGVDIFVLISGYFLIDQDSFNIRKIIRFWGQLAFYSVLLHLAFLIFGKVEFTPLSALESLLPVSCHLWWFPSTYFVLYLIHPYLNGGLKNLERKKYQSLLILLLGIWCMIPTFTSLRFQSNNLLWFITLYAVAGYIRLFDLNTRCSPRNCLALFVLASLLRYASAVTLILWGTTFPLAARCSIFFYGTQSVLTFGSALFLFLFFVNLKLSFHRWINWLGAASFGVYLIHDHRLIRRFLWFDVFQTTQYQDTAIIIPCSIGIVIMVYIFCTCVDLGRIYFFEKPVMRFIDRHINKWELRMCNAIESVKVLLFGKQTDANK